MNSGNVFWSNCLLEAVKAKVRDSSVRILYIPAFLNEVPCPHLMWLDENGEHDFHHNGRLPFYKWLLHKGRIDDYPQGTYRSCITQMIKYKYYDPFQESLKNGRGFRFGPCEKIIDKVIMDLARREYKRFGRDIFYIKGRDEDYPRYLLYTENENTYRRMDEF